MKAWGWLGCIVIIVGFSSVSSMEEDPHSWACMPLEIWHKILFEHLLPPKDDINFSEEPWQGIDDETTRQIQSLLLNEAEATVIVATNELHFMRQCHQTITLS